MAKLSPAPIRQLTKVFLTPNVSDLLFYESVMAERKNHPAYGTAHPDTTKWPNHKLCYIAAQDDPERDELYRYYYVADRATQDPYNWEFSQADIGGTKFDSVLRTYVTLRSAYSPTTPAQGSAMPNVPASLFGTGSGTPSVVAAYALSGRTGERIGDKELDSLFVVEQLEWVKRTSINEIGVDPLNGLPLFSSTSLFYRTEIVAAATVGASTFTAEVLFSSPSNAFWGLQATGYQNSGKQLTSAWYLIEIEQVVGGTFAAGAVTMASYPTNENYYWPPVLESYELLDWVRRDGGTDYYPMVKMNPEAYNGPCKTDVVLTWSKSAFTIPKVIQMLPTRIYYSSPFFALNIPECLHGAQAIACDIGTSDPVYDQNAGSTRTFAATSHTAWPASLVAYDSQEPYRGGFLRTTKTITKPS